MTSKILMAMVTVLMAQSALAGAANATLKCASGSGRTTLEAEFPVDMTEASMKVTVDGKSLTYINQEMVDTLTLNERDPNAEFPGHKVVGMTSGKSKSSITMTADTDSGGKFSDVHLHLRSVGALSAKGALHNQTIQFNAVLNGEDPRQASELLPQISVKCVYKYSL